MSIHGGGALPESTGMILKKEEKKSIDLLFENCLLAAGAVIIPPECNFFAAPSACCYFDIRFPAIGIPVRIKSVIWC